MIALVTLFLKAVFVTALSPVWVAVLLVKGAMSAFPEKEPETSGAHGSAKLADYDSLKEAGMMEPKGGVVVGFAEKKVLWRTMRARVYDHWENSQIMFGSRGAGKTQTIIANLLCLKYWKRQLPDLLIADAPGDIYAATHASLRALGYDVLLLDVKNPEKSVYFDPLSYLANSRSIEDDASMIAELTIPPEVKENHFSEVPRNLLAGIIAHEYAMNPVHINYETCLRYLRGDKAKKQQNIFSLTSSPDPMVADNIEAFIDAGDRERGSFSTTMSRRYKPFLTGNVRKIISIPAGKRGLCFDDMFAHERPVALFIRTGLASPSTGPLVRILMGTAINTARRWWDNNEKPLPKGLRIFIDEAATIGNCPPLVEAIRELRKADVNTFMCYTSRSDLFDNFPEAKTISNGCTWLVTGGSNDYETAEAVSRLGGSETVLARGVSATGEVNFHETKKDVISAYEVRGMPYDEIMVLMGHTSARLKKAFRKKNGVPDYN
ncbi:type IV secretory system conjugative DNA transfer family protein [Jiella pelagia]|uniref:Type IV secretory system conjugative DNA transfer family protein n=1 Tax=Jiella pelagia TaxID=2986949 RepID=A0ABY7BYS9_9HYPH|nr:type IV secretory system conjugative DNA transfer family protein [Jiella pelagia]WAP69022.1 type IV secretory system conjugative DNA transfer family protein [Jiella pelagia]